MTDTRSAWRCAVRSARSAGALTGRRTAAAVKEGVPTSTQRRGWAGMTRRFENGFGGAERSSALSGCGLQ